MADWLNHATVLGARNGTTTHTLSADGTGGSVIAGSGFTPTSGRLLVCFGNGGVTATTPTGWTLPTNGSAIGNTGLYVWWRTATATSADQVATTHNGSNYPFVFDFYEFPSTASFNKAAAASGTANGGAGPNLTTLTGTNWTAGAAGNWTGNGQSIGTYSWGTGTEITDVAAAYSGTDGYAFSTTATDQDTATSRSYAATYSGSTSGFERLAIAISVAAASTPAIPPFLIMQTRRP